MTSAPNKSVLHPKGGDHYDPQFVTVPHVRHTEKLMAWGCSSYYGVRNFLIIEGVTLNGERYLFTV